MSGTCNFCTQLQSTAVFESRSKEERARAREKKRERERERICDRYFDSQHKGKETRRKVRDRVELGREEEILLRVCRVGYTQLEKEREGLKLAKTN